MAAALPWHRLLVPFLPKWGAEMALYVGKEFACAMVSDMQYLHSLLA
jgi:hypothetical protein